MKLRSSIPFLASGLGLFGLAMPFSSHSWNQDPAPSQSPDTMTERAKGTFEVALQPLSGDEEWGRFARMSLDKAFQGDLSGTSKGVMLAAQTATKGSAGYVALERVTAELAERKGTFVLQHSGTMGGGKQSLDVRVVPDSGTDELKGLSGSMEILIEKDRHSYVFSYSLPAREAGDSD